MNAECIGCDNLTCLRALFGYCSKHTERIATQGDTVDLSSPNNDCDSSKGRMAEARPVSRKPVGIASVGGCDSCGDAI